MKKAKLQLDKEMTKSEITFEEVKYYIFMNCPDAIESIVNATESFVMDYVKCPVGYAETDKLEDGDKLTKEINDHFKEFNCEDGRVRRGMINAVIKMETKRWNEERSAWYYGRHIGRLAYLLNNLKK